MPDEKPLTLQSAVDSILDEGLDKFLVRPEVQGFIVEAIVENTKLPIGPVRLGVRLITPLVASKAQAGLGWLGKQFALRVSEHTRSVGGPRIFSALLDQLRAIKEKADAAGGLEKLIDGEVPAGEVPFRARLSLEQRTVLRQIELDEEILGL